MLFSSSLHSPTFDVLGLDVYPVPRPRPCPWPFLGPHPARPEFCPCPTNLAWVILDLARSQLKINVGRRGTNWAQSPPDLDWYLDVLSWNTPLKIPPPAALVEGVLLRWFILSCEYCISISETRAHTCYQTCYQSRRKMILKNCHILESVLGILSFPSPILRFPSPKIQFSSPKIPFSSHEIRFTQIGFLLSLTAFRFLQQLSDFLRRLSAFSNGFPNFSDGFLIFLNSFPLSKKSEKIHLWQEVYERSLFELCIFRHSLPKLRDYR